MLWTNEGRVRHTSFNVPLERAAVVLYSRIFENHLHKFLPGPLLSLQLNFSITALLLLKFGSLLATRQERNTCYLQPLSLFFPSFDSFLYQQPRISKSGFSRLIALQAADHAIYLEDGQKTSLKPNVLG
jgi:hypothetical protein